MLDNLFGDVNAQEQKINEALSQIEGSTTAGDITLRYRASGQVLAVQLGDALLARGDGEEIEDLLITAMEQMLVDMKTHQAEVSKKVISELLPPGMSGLFGS